MSSPDLHETFEVTDVHAPWAEAFVPQAGRGGKGGLRFGPFNERSTLAWLPSSFQGQRVRSIRTTSSLFLARGNGRSRITVVAWPEDGSGPVFMKSRHLRAHELPLGTWTDVEMEVFLDRAGPDLQGVLAVHFDNEGGSEWAMDGLRVTAVTEDVPGSPPGRPFDPTDPSTTPPDLDHSTWDDHHPLRR